MRWSEAYAAKKTAEEDGCEANTNALRGESLPAIRARDSSREDRRNLEAAGAQGLLPVDWQLPLWHAAAQRGWRGRIGQRRKKERSTRRRRRRRRKKTTRCACGLKSAVIEGSTAGTTESQKRAREIKNQEISGRFGAGLKIKRGGGVWRESYIVSDQVVRGGQVDDRRQRIFIPVEAVRFSAGNHNPCALQGAPGVLGGDAAPQAAGVDSSAQALTTQVMEG